MKDEIKEILDNFKDYELRYKQCNENQFIIFYRDIHLLLDYITNLQKENERLKEENILLKASEPMSKLLEDYGYKSRCEKAIKKLESIRTFGLRCGKTLFSTLINESIDILNGGDE